MALYRADGYCCPGHFLFQQAGCLAAFAWFGGEVFFEFPLFTIEFFGISRRFAFLDDVRPDLCILSVDLQPLVEAGFGVGFDRFGGTFRFADAAVDAFVRVNDEHVLAFIEAINWADFYAVHVLAFDTIIDDQICHFGAGTFSC